eukprot:1341621-Pyramimonas_sp.AAC.1
MAATLILAARARAQALQSQLRQKYSGKIHIGSRGQDIPKVKFSGWMSQDSANDVGVQRAAKGKLMGEDTPV